MAYPQTPRLLTPAFALIAAVFVLALAMPRSALAHVADGHPARIHEGSCTATGPVADQLTGVGATVSLEGTPIPEPTVTGAETAAPLDVSETAIADSLDHLTGEAHAIVIYESDEAMDHTIACGDIGGPVSADGTLAVWLAPTADSEDAGLALLRNDGDSAVSVTIYLAEPGEEHEHAEAPAATPSS